MNKKKKPIDGDKIRKLFEEVTVNKFGNIHGEAINVLYQAIEELGGESFLQRTPKISWALNIVYELQNFGYTIKKIGNEK